MIRLFFSLKILFPIFIFFIFCNITNAQTADSSGIKSKLYRYWELREYKENGKAQDLPEFLIEFKSDGNYYSIEEDEPDTGTWVISDDETKIIFDKDTENEDVWNIISLEDSKLVVKFSNEGRSYQYTLLPAVLEFK